MEILERLSPSYWWSDPGTSIDGPVPIAFAVVLAVAFLAAMVTWLLADRIAPENRLHRRLIIRAAKWTLSLSAVGLVLLLFRWQIVPFFSKRVWVFLWCATVIGAFGYAAYYWRRLYPDQLLAWEDSERRRRYMPRAGRQRRRSRRRH